jgi:hypothetical protein
MAVTDIFQGNKKIARRKRPRINRNTCRLPVTAGLAARRSGGIG